MLVTSPHWTPDSKSDAAPRQTPDGRTWRWKGLLHTECAMRCVLLQVKERSPSERRDVTHDAFDVSCGVGLVCASAKMRWKVTTFVVIVPQVSRPFLGNKIIPWRQGQGRISLRREAVSFCGPATKNNCETSHSQKTKLVNKNSGRTANRLWAQCIVLQTLRLVVQWSPDMPSRQGQRPLAREQVLQDQGRVQFPWSECPN